MSAIGGKADIGLTPRNVRFWPKADIRLRGGRLCALSGSVIEL